MQSLLGRNSPYSPEMTQLLGLDPAEMRRQAIFRGLQQAGVQLMSSGKLGDAFQGLSQGVDEAKDDYMQQKMIGYKMKTAEEDRAYQNAEREAKKAERAQFDSYVSTLPPDLQPAIRANPGLMDNYITANDPRFQPADTSDPKSYAPIPYSMGENQIGYGIPREDGTFTPVAPPEGGNFLSPYEKNFQTQMGKTDAAQQSAAPSDIAAADVALALLDDIENDPNLAWGVGGTSVFNAIPGTPGMDFQNKVNQATSGAFLSAIQQLRGMGALSNAEGQVATQAVTRMNTATSEEAFKSALNDYRQIVMSAKMRAASKVPGVEAQPAAPAAPRRLRYNPATGTLE
jgi:hypothetical protein